MFLQKPLIIWVVFFLNKWKNISGSNIAFAFGLCNGDKAFQHLHCLLAANVMSLEVLLVERTFSVQEPYVWRR